MSISIQLNPETEQRLDFLVTQTGRSKADYLQEIIENGIEDLEDYYLAAEVLERVKNGQEKVFSTSEVRKSLGLDD
jgi:RHH-type rel operon transcriptional repressor/antitoxin RelB